MPTFSYIHSCEGKVAEHFLASLFSFTEQIPLCYGFIQSQEYHFTQFFIVLKGSLWKCYRNKLQMETWPSAKLCLSLPLYQHFFSPSALKVLYRVGNIYLRLILETQNIAITPQTILIMILI